MTYRVIATEIVDDTDRVVFNALDNKLIRRKLCQEMNRAEAAEKRAADAEVRAKSWHDSAMTLADQRDAAYKRNTELEAALNDIKANTFMPDGTRLSDAVKQVMQERDELARKLEQAQQALIAVRDWFARNTKQGHTPGPTEKIVIDAIGSE